MTSTLTGDADSCLPALGGAKVAPGHTETPIVLGAMEVLHLLAGHIDHHLTHLQPWEKREDKGNQLSQICMHKIPYFRLNGFKKTPNKSFIFLS